MRRPVKPFVTEYRGGARRQMGGQGQASKPTSAKLDGDPAESRASPSWPPRSAPSSQEDSYEAALRAADALFSGRRQQPAASPAAAVPSSPVEAPDDAAAPSSPGGRILRAIDEPPSPELLKLEAEFAPKRRGRKPGSKNKPKILPPVIEDAVPAASPPLAHSPAAPPPAAAGHVARLATFVPAPTASRPVAVRSDRYAWVRTKLKPGQQWKRRLPKVAW